MIYWHTDNHIYESARLLTLNIIQEVNIVIIMTVLVLHVVNYVMIEGQKKHGWIWYAPFLSFILEMKLNNSSWDETTGMSLWQNL